MSKTRCLRLCLVVLVCLSGCNALTGDPTPETPPLTSADVPTDDPNATRGLAPGLTNQGVVDPVALRRAHEAVLTKTSFTRQGNMTITYTNGTVRGQIISTTRMVAPKDRYYGTMEKYGQSTNGINDTPDNLSSWSKSVWVNGERKLVARSSSKTNTTTYQHSESAIPAWLESMYIWGEQYSRLFQVLNTTVVNHTMNNGTTLYRIAATGIADPERLTRSSGTNNPRNLTFHAVIDSRGLVHRHRLAYTATLTETNRPTPIRVVDTQHYTNIGATTVDRPPWYTAANRTTPMTSNSRS